MKFKRYLYIFSILVLICSCSNLKDKDYQKYTKINHISSYIPAGYLIEAKLLAPIDNNFSGFGELNKERPVLFIITNNILIEKNQKSEYYRDSDLKMTDEVKNCFVIGKYKTNKQISLESFLCSYDKNDYPFILGLYTIEPDLLVNIFDAISVDGFAEIDNNKIINSFPLKEQKEVKLFFKKAVRPILFNDINKTKYRIDNNIFLKIINISKEADNESLK